MAKLVSINSKQKKTAEHMSNPQLGDRFCDMYFFWVHVVGRFGNEIHVEEYIPPCTLITDAKRRQFKTVREFQKAYAYGNNSANGYWVSYVDSLAPFDHYKKPRKRAIKRKDAVCESQS